MSARRPFLVYLAWQLPGWIAAGLVVAWLVTAFDLALHVGVIVVALYVLKDLVLYPVMAPAFRAPVSHQHVGAIAETVEALTPAGYVRVGGELWKARTTGAHVPVGARVVVRGARGLTLIVDPVLAPDLRAPREPRPPRS